MAAQAPAVARPAPRPRLPWRRLLLHSLAIAGVVMVLLPAYWMLITSFKPRAEIMTYPMTWFPVAPTLDNYRRVFEAMPFGRYMFNSAFVSAVVMVSNLLLCSLAGYSLALFRYPGRDLVFLLILGTMMIPVQLLFIPLFLVVKALGLVNTYAALIVPLAMTPMGVFLMRQSMLGMPRELVEAARIDGASEVAIWARIVMPLMGPGLAALAIFSFMWSWNAFLWPLIVIGDASLFTLPLGLAAFQDLYEIEFGPMMAGMVLSVVPVVLAFVFLQRYFIKGLTLTGLKG